MSKATDLVGSAGLFAAAAELARWDWLVSPTFGNAKRTDLLAQHTAIQRTAAIQVKTRARGDFQLDVFDHAPPDANEWVVLVTLGERGTQPAFNVVPRNHVCLVVRMVAALKESEGKSWPRKVITEREFARYRGCWELMTAPAEEAPWMLRQWVFDYLANYPQPELLAPAAPATEA